MNNIVNFCNNGEIGPRMWNTFGVSVKTTEESIGQFSTGLKYAIAVMVRNGRSLKIVSAGNDYVFSSREAESI